MAAGGDAGVSGRGRPEIHRGELPELGVGVLCLEGLEDDAMLGLLSRVARDGEVSHFGTPTSRSRTVGRPKPDERVLALGLALGLALERPLLLTVRFIRVQAGEMSGG